MGARDAIKETIKRSRAQARIEREAYFSCPGATAEGWRGGRAAVQQDRKKEGDRRACRRPAEEE